MNKKNDLFKLMRLLILTNNLKSVINPETRDFLEVLSNDYLNPTAATIFIPYPSLPPDELNLSLSSKRSRSIQLPNTDLATSVNSNYHTRLSSEEPQPKKSKLSFSDETAFFKHIQSSSVNKYKSTLPVETSSSQPERPLEGTLPIFPKFALDGSGASIRPSSNIPAESRRLKPSSSRKNRPVVSHQNAFKEHGKHPPNRKVQINPPVPQVHGNLAEYQTLQHSSSPPLFNQHPSIAKTLPLVPQKLVLKEKPSNEIGQINFPVRAFFIPPPDDYNKSAMCLLDKIFFTWHRYEPSTRDGKIVLQAFNSLQIAEETPFFHPAESNTLTGASTDIDSVKFDQLHICLVPLESKKNKIALFKYFVKIKLAIDKAKAGSKGKSDYKPDRAEPGQGRACAFAIFTREDGVAPETISKYKEYVMADFHEHFSNLEKQHKKSPNFRVIKTLFPMFLFYVDMMSVIAPKENLDNEGHLLRTQRNLAAMYYFQAVKSGLGLDTRGDSHRKHLLTYQKPDKTSSRSRRVKSFKAFPFMWRVLEDWMIVSRHFLCPESEGYMDYLHQFFNKIFVDWVLRQSQIPSSTIKKRLRISS